MTRWKRARLDALQRWAEIERSGYLSAVVQDAVARHAAGERRAAQHVALNVLEDVWLSTSSRPLANLAYSRTLGICRQAIHDAAATTPPAVFPARPDRMSTRIG
jgi:hypothetical protein